MLDTIMIWLEALPFKNYLQLTLNDNNNNKIVILIFMIIPDSELAIIIMKLMNTVKKFKCPILK